MTYLLDTCILSKLRRIKSHPDPRLENWLKKHREQDFYISVLSLGEIQQGIYKLKEPVFQRQLEEWLFGSLIPRFENRILPLDLRVTLKWGELSGSYQKIGIPLPIADALIAATGIVHDQIIVTENIKDFSRIKEAKIFNPWE